MGRGFTRKEQRSCNVPRVYADLSGNHNYKFPFCLLLVFTFEGAALLAATSNDPRKSA